MFKKLRHFLFNRKVYGANYWYVTEYHDGRVEESEEWQFVDPFTDGKTPVHPNMVWFKCDIQINDQTGIFNCGCGFVRHEKGNDYRIEFVNHSIKQVICYSKPWVAEMDYLKFLETWSWKGRYDDLYNKVFIKQ